MMPESALQQLKSSLRGQTLCPGDLGYDAARKVPNAMVNRRPAIIARCAGAADVIACVRFAREHDVIVSVRGGGHSVAGKSVCDAGLMIDLSAMKGIRVDRQRKPSAPKQVSSSASSIAKPRLSVWPPHWASFPIRAYLGLPSAAVSAT